MCEDNDQTEFQVAGTVFNDLTYTVSLKLILHAMTLQFKEHAKIHKRCSVGIRFVDYAVGAKLKHMKWRWNNSWL